MRCEFWVDYPVEKVTMTSDHIMSKLLAFWQQLAGDQSIYCKTN